MKVKENNKNLIKYLVILLLVYILLFIIRVFYIKKSPEDFVPDIIKTSIIDSNEKYSINVEYPRFNKEKIDRIITDYIYKYIKEFKSYDSNNKSLFIDYELYYKEDFINVLFIIDNTLVDDKYYNVIIDYKKEEKASITDLYGEDIINKIYTYSNYKYSNEINDKIINSNINDFTYLLNDYKITVYFYNIDFTECNYKPYVSFSTDDSSLVFYEKELNDNAKHIIFTFDDGPSEYTDELLHTLELNESSATFFVLGNKMKNSEDTIKKIFNSNSEIGTHTYSHKYLTLLTEEYIKSEINSSTILFNEITGGEIEYLRPPYGSYDDRVQKNSPYPLILWNIDTKDWFYKDSNKIYNEIINNACDGCIVLMHDTYETTIEAVKKVIPELKNMGYEIVNISDALKIKNKELNAGEVVRRIVE